MRRRVRATGTCGITRGPRYNAALQPDRRVIVYCASGARGSLATLTLKNMGYKNVANMEGGFKGWVAAGLPTTEHHADF